MLKTPLSLSTLPDMAVRMYLDYRFYGHCTCRRSVRGHPDLLTSPVKFLFVKGYVKKNSIW